MHSQIYSGLSLIFAIFLRTRILVRPPIFQLILMFNVLFGSLNICLRPIDAYIME